MPCSKDDTGTCCGKCNEVVAVIPVLGRRPLLKHTITRLLQKNKVGHVICVGHAGKDQRVCEEAGAEFLHHPNEPLGAKWNSGFQHAQKYSPIACLFVGSSDWLSDNWLPKMVPHLKEFDLIGKPGCHFLDINQGNYRACEWQGYTGARANESIGIGRLISARALSLLKWKPFDDHLNKSLDHSMQQRVSEAGGQLKIINDPETIALSISTDQWDNKHKFQDHVTGELQRKSSTIVNVDEFLKNNFPEAYHIFT